MTAWSRERPTKAGWYWWRSPTYLGVKMIYMDENGVISDRGMLEKLNARSHEHPIGGEWQGPLEPKE